MCLVVFKMASSEFGPTRFPANPVYSRASISRSRR